MAKLKVRGSMDNFARHACPDCCICTGGPDNIKRLAVFFLSFGMVAFALPFFKKCPTCGHNMFMNNHKPHKDEMIVHNK